MQLIKIEKVRSEREKNKLCRNVGAGVDEAIFYSVRIGKQVWFVLGAAHLFWRTIDQNGAEKNGKIDREKSKKSADECGVVIYVRFAFFLCAWSFFVHQRAMLSHWRKNQKSAP